MTDTVINPRPAPFDSVRRLFTGTNGWLIIAVLVALLALLPVVSLIIIASGGNTATWSHLATYVLPSAVPTTALLLGGVAIVVIAVGTGAAWLVTAYDFPGRRIFDWALLLPLAVPTYVVAFAYLDLLHPLGPVQSAMRAMLGIASPRDFRLPDIRNMTGAILLFGFVLYPYVYLATRAMFLMQAAGFIEAARTLGAGRKRVFFRIAMPLARPAIAVGTSLALMEALNDVGASEFLGIRTLTISVYSTWVNQSDLPGSAGIALFMLLVVVLLVWLERAARRRQRFTAMTQRGHAPARNRLHGASALAAIVLATLPILIGFLIPTVHLMQTAIARIGFAGISGKIVQEAINTVSVSALATLIAVAVGLVLAFAARIDHRPLGRTLLRVSSLGYALPGTVLAIGLFIPLARFDNIVDGYAREFLGISTGLLLAGSGAALIYAYVVRFLAVSAGGIDTGFDKIPRSLDHSARSLGRSPAGMLREIHLPLMRPALGAAAILVFVDCMKELPATLLLRPMNFETLATHLYGEAVRGTYEEGAIAALAIVLVGLLPVIVLARLGRPALQAQNGAT
jgi:iron(III) transport system permease protein